MPGVGDHQHDRAPPRSAVDELGGARRLVVLVVAEHPAGERRRRAPRRAAAAGGCPRRRRRRRSASSAAQPRRGVGDVADRGGGQHQRPRRRPRASPGRCMSPPTYDAPRCSTPEPPGRVPGSARRASASAPPSARRDRLWGWVGAARWSRAIAGFLRFWHLGQPRALVFDETYYVKDACIAAAVRLRANHVAQGRATTVFTPATPTCSAPAADFVVHPPVGKWMIAAGRAGLRRRRPFGLAVLRGRRRHPVGADARPDRPAAVPLHAPRLHRRAAAGGRRPPLRAQPHRPARHLPHVLGAGGVRLPARRP